MVENLPENARVAILVDHTPIGAKVVPHRTDDSKLMLKSGNPEGAALLAQLAGVSPGPTTRGSRYFMVEVDKAAFLSGLSQAVDAVLSVTQPTKVAEPEVQKCPECGTDDGTHWQFCDAKQLN